MFSVIPIDSWIEEDHPLRKMADLVEGVLGEMSEDFDEIYSHTGRPSIPPEHLLKALLLQVLFTIRSEQLQLPDLFGTTAVAMESADGKSDAFVLSKKFYRNDLAERAFLGGQTPLSNAADPFYTEEGHSGKTVYAHGMQDAADPVTPRPLITDLDASSANPTVLRNVVEDKLVTMANICFQLTPTDLRKLKLSKDNLEQEILRKSGVNTVLSPWPPAKEDLKEFLEASGELPLVPCSRFVAPVASADTLQEIELALEGRIQAPLEIFRKSCSECHGTNPLSGIELPLDSLEDMKEFQGSRNIVSAP